MWQITDKSVIVIGFWFLLPVLRVRYPSRTQRILWNVNYKNKAENMQIDLRFSLGFRFKRNHLIKLLLFAYTFNKTDKFNRRALFHVGIKVTNICVNLQ